MRMQMFLLGFLLIAISMAAGYAYCSYSSPMHERHVFGRVERGYLGEDQISLKIRMDTGAKTSSLSAHDIKIFTKDGEQFVSFIIEPERTQSIHRFELPLKRLVKIRKRQAEMQDEQEDENIDPHQAYDQRPVVLMPLCLGDQHQIIEVTLTDRSPLNYPMLLGRSAMRAFGVLIDPSVTFTQKKRCDHSNIVEHKES